MTSMKELQNIIDYSKTQKNNAQFNNWSLLYYSEQLQSSFFSSFQRHLQFLVENGQFCDCDTVSLIVSQYWLLMGITDYK